MAPAYVSALSNCQPPDTDHSPVALSHIVVLVESFSDMTVAIVTENMVRELVLPTYFVHSLFIYCISFDQSIVIFLRVVDVQGDISKNC